MPEEIGRLLVNKKIISERQLKRAIEKQKVSGEQLASVLVKLGLITERTLLSFLSSHYAIPSLALPPGIATRDLIEIVPANLACKYLIFPLALRDSTLVIAMADPANIFAIDDIKFLTGYRIEVCPARETVIRKLIDEHYCPHQPFSGGDTNHAGRERPGESAEERTGRRALTSSREEAPAITLVNRILVDAVEQGASDIHLEPHDKLFRVRFRIDGVLHDVLHPPLHFKDAITSRIKIISKLDIAERRLPQDGRVKITMENGREVDFRVSVIPTLFGEKIVMRLLDRLHLKLDMTSLGFEADDLAVFLQRIGHPYGMVLVTGPTGSGKTTTLYSALNSLNQTAKNISTVEDPVEYNLPGVNQVQIHEEIGLTFARVLRAFLRQDPDVILVGEIRDYETADIAIKAALTGHLVLSTLHTNDAPSAISRLVQMGIQPYLITSSVLLIVAQRLVRRICIHCKQPAVPAPRLCLELGIHPGEIPSPSLYRGTGCRMCSYTGFRGRVAVYELMHLTEHIRHCILDGASSGDLKREAVKAGMVPLRARAIERMEQGLTTAEEVITVTATL